MEEGVSIHWRVHMICIYLLQELPPIILHRIPVAPWGEDSITSQCDCVTGLVEVSA